MPDLTSTSEEENNEWVYNSTVEPHPVTNSEGYYVVENRASVGNLEAEPAAPLGGMANRSEYHELRSRTVTSWSPSTRKCLDVSEEKPPMA
jgi:hypothetical protein